VRIIDKKGFIKLQFSNAFYTEIVAPKRMKSWFRYGSAIPIIRAMCHAPDLFLVVGSHIIELSKIVYKDQVTSIIHAQLAGLEGQEKILVVGVSHG
jgi:hypothetical protein